MQRIFNAEPMKPSIIAASCLLASSCVNTGPATDAIDIDSSLSNTLPVVQCGGAVPNGTQSNELNGFSSLYLDVESITGTGSMVEIYAVTSSTSSCYVVFASSFGSGQLSPLDLLITRRFSDIDGFRSRVVEILGDDTSRCHNFFFDELSSAEDAAIQQCARVGVNRLASQGVVILNDATIFGGERLPFYFDGTSLYGEE